MNPARPFADGDGGGDFEIIAADDREVAGFFVRDENLVIGGVDPRGEGKKRGEDRASRPFRQEIELHNEMN